MSDIFVYPTVSVHTPPTPQPTHTPHPSSYTLHNELNLYITQMPKSHQMKMNSPSRPWPPDSTALQSHYDDRNTHIA